jgi:hypothetical protein
MADKLELLLEGERRGILDDRNQSLLEEARKRNLVPASALPSSPSLHEKYKDDPNIKVVRVDGEDIPVFRPRAEEGRKVGGSGGFIETAAEGTLVGAMMKDRPVGPRGASIPTLIGIGAQSPDPDVRLRAFAKARDEEDELSRYRKLPSGEIVRRGDDGVWYSETPSQLRTMAGQVIQDIPQTAVSTGALVAGGPWAGPIAAGVIEGGAEAAKRAYARNVLGEKGSAFQAYGVRPSIYGVTAGVGGVISKYGGKGAVVGTRKLQRGLGRTGEVGRIVKAEEVVDPVDIARRAEGLGKFGLTKAGVARTAQSPRLGAYEQFIGPQATRAGDIVRKSHGELEEQITEAMVKGKGGLPKLLTKAEGAKSGKALVELSERSGVALSEMRKKHTKPLYEKAFRKASEVGGEIDVTGTLKKIDDEINKATSSTTRRMWESIKSDFYRTDPETKEKVALSSISDLDSLGKDILSIAKSQDASSKYGAKRLSSAVHRARQWLVDDIDRHIGGTVDKPGSYRKAISLYKRYSDAIKAYDESVFGKLKDLTPDEYHKAPGILFGENTSPRTIANAKTRILKRVKGGKEIWDTAIRGSLLDVPSDVIKKGEISTKKMANLKAALDPDQFEAFSEFTTVLKDIQFVPFARKTAPGVAEGARVAEREIGGVGPRGLRRTTPSVLVHSKVISDNRIRKAGEAIARELTTPEGIDNLLRLKQLPDKYEKMAAVLFYFGTNVAGKNVVESRMSVGKWPWQTGRITENGGEIK